MHSFVLQDWITVRGQTVTPLVQSELDWLDLGPFQDVVAWIDVRESSPAGTTPVLYLETAPTKDDVLFMSMNGTVAIPNGYTMAASSSPQVAQLLMGSAITPLARFLRWKIIGPGSAWDATFRIMIAANSPGM